MIISKKSGKGVRDGRGNGGLVSNRNQEQGNKQYPLLEG